MKIPPLTMENNIMKNRSKKEKNCNKLLALFTSATALLFGLVGVGVGLMKTQFKSALAVEYEDLTNEINLSVDESNNYIFTNFFNYLYTYYEDNEDQMMNLNLNYNDDEYFPDDYNFTDDYFVWNGSNDKIYFNLYDKKFHLIEDSNELPFAYSLNLTFDDSSDYEDGKSAIELDIQANQPRTMGGEILSTIEAGLGLIGDLAEEFLAGFTAIFWVNNGLTDFAIFSLVMLGIAVSFAIVKLILIIIRSNTGA